MHASHTIRLFLPAAQNNTNFGHTLGQTLGTALGQTLGTLAKTLGTARRLPEVCPKACPKACPKSARSFRGGLPEACPKSPLSLPEVFHRGLPRAYGKALAALCARPVAKRRALLWLGIRKLLPCLGPGLLRSFSILGGVRARPGTPAPLITGTLADPKCARSFVSWRHSARCIPFKSYPCNVQKKHTQKKKATRSPTGSAVTDRPTPFRQRGPSTMLRGCRRH